MRWKDSANFEGKKKKKEQQKKTEDGFDTDQILVGVSNNKPT